MSIVIRIEELRDGARDGEDTLPESFAAERLGADFKVKAPLKVRWRAHMVHQLVEVTARIDGSLAFGCSRCGDPLTLPVALDVQHHWVAEGSLDDGDDELDGDDPDLSEHDGVSIDLLPVLLDAVVVEIPLAPACVDAVEARCENYSDDPIVYHAGIPPDDVDTHRPFAKLLARLSDDGPAEA